MNVAEFKARDRKGRWVRGGYALNKNEHVIVVCEKEWIRHIYVGDKLSLGEYTGKRDKKGFKIYTNDIIAVYGEGIEGAEGIVFKNAGACWVDLGKKYILLANSKYEFVTYGNITENKEKYNNIMEIKGR